MASSEEYQQKQFWNSGLSKSLKDNGWVEEEHNGNKIVYNKRFFHEFLYGDVSNLIKKDDEGKK